MTLLTAAWEGPAGGPAYGQSQDSGLATEPCSLAHGSAASEFLKQESCQLRGLRGVPRMDRETDLVEEPSAQLPREPHKNMWVVGPTHSTAHSSPAADSLASVSPALSGQGIGVQSHLIWVPK